MSRPRVGIGVIVQRGPQVLIGQRLGSIGAGEWALPGGHLEHGESFEACAAREVWEETGLSVTDVRFATAENVVFPHGGPHCVTVFMTSVAPPDAQPHVLEPDKCAGWKWVEWGALQQHQPLFLPLKQLLQRGFAPPGVPGP